MIRTLLIAVSLLLLWPQSAHAGRLVVLQFRGSGPAAQARLSLVRPLLAVDGLTLLPQADYAAQAQSVGVGRNELATPSGVRRGAAVAAVDAVVAGRTIRKNNRWHVRLSYYEADGTRRLQRDYLLVQGRFRQADLNRIIPFITEKTQASASVAPVSSSTPPPRVEDPPHPPPHSRETVESSSDTATSAQSGWLPSAPTEESRESASRRDGAEARSSPRREGRARGSEFGGPEWATQGRGAGDFASSRPMLSIIAVAGGANRTYYMQGARTSITYETTKPSSGKGLALFPEVGAVVQSFPSRDGGPWVEGIGIEAGFSRGFVSSQFSSGGAVTPIDTPVHRINLDGRWNYRVLGRSAFSPEVGVRAGFGVSDFRSSVANTAFTGVRHGSIRLGAEAAQPLLPGLLRLEGMIVLMPLAFPGQAEKNAYGDDAKASGWAGRLGLSGVMSRGSGGLAWRVSVERQSISTEFVGTGTRDDGGSSDESYLAIHGGIGFAF